jgi:transcriptional regulator with XRE-family HTH domain
MSFLYSARGGWGAIMVKGRDDYTGSELLEKIMEQFPGETQKDVASLLGISASTMTGWKTGISKPTVELLDKVAKLKSLSPDWWRMPWTREKVEAEKPHLTPRQQSLLKHIDQLIDLREDEVERLTAFRRFVMLYPGAADVIDTDMMRILASAAN